MNASDHRPFVAGRADLPDGDAFVFMINKENGDLLKREMAVPAERMRAVKADAAAKLAARDRERICISSDRVIPPHVTDRACLATHPCSYRNRNRTHPCTPGSEAEADAEVRDNCLDLLRLVRDATVPAHSEIDIELFASELLDRRHQLRLENGATYVAEFKQGPRQPTPTVFVQRQFFAAADETEAPTVGGHRDIYRSPVRQRVPMLVSWCHRWLWWLTFPWPFSFPRFR